MTSDSFFLFCMTNDRFYNVHDSSICDLFLVDHTKVQCTHCTHISTRTWLCTQTGSAARSVWGTQSCMLLSKRALSRQSIMQSIIAPGEAGVQKLTQKKNNIKIMSLSIYFAAKFIFHRLVTVFFLEVFFQGPAGVIKLTMREVRLCIEGVVIYSIIHRLSRLKWISTHTRLILALKLVRR